MAGLWSGLLFMVVTVIPVLVAVVLYQFEEFDPARIPDQGSNLGSMKVPNQNDRVIEVSERIGDGFLPGPEDIVYDAESGFIYTGCVDGWIKRVRLAESMERVTVENWVYVGGRPVGLAIAPDKSLVVAESYKGLLRVTKEGGVELLTDEAEGLKFRLTNGVDVAKDGVIYFSDASYKYNLSEHMKDIFEGRPYGRLLNFDPSINQTKVLARDLYFANGVTLSPDQDFVIFCETPLYKCKKSYIKGEKNGSIENFIDNLPGVPDNIHYDGKGHYWIAFPTGRTKFRDMVLGYPFFRKALVVLEKYVKLSIAQTDSGILAVDLDGKPVALYYDPKLSMVTSGLPIGKHLYYCSLVNSYISRLDLTLHSARPI